MLARKYKIGWLRRTSANRSRIVKGPFHLSIFSRTSAHYIFYYGHHRGNRLERCSRVCTIYPTIRAPWAAVQLWCAPISAGKTARPGNWVL